MRRGAGIALTASALSITVGVLVGAVITIGSASRADSPPPAVPVSSVADAATSQEPPAASHDLSDDPISVPAPGTSISVAAASSVLPTPAPGPAPAPTAILPARTTATPATTKRPTSPIGSPKPVLILTTVTLTPKVTVATTAAPSTAQRSIPAAATRHPGQGPQAGVVAAGAPCPQLGAEATVPQGWNVFCQHNFPTGTLAWRAVVDGGGCLSRRMTGIGMDGYHYVCRPYGPYLDRWHRAR